ncbi:helix-turn-helix domain-containing protein [Saccharopolyspora gloriosae]|uniref:Transcriptional regulator GlxA family with amidase domain n=1 Tax=Saccharopolyspora gloriosae TaxID=455344 RepID=A0A840NIR4_9PSEU|nr:helix-turn-helix domain-containing protein [Saccharopolyspora gloriosae]MBB5070188.1 transcriptional regulator GlxA family with amidase domain [Saccharopolyspora gloriosae]
MPTGTVAVAVVDGMPMYELSIACEIFGTARPDLADPWYSLRLCAADPGGTSVQGGFQVRTEHGLDALAAADTVVVPALPDHGTEPEPRLVDAVRAAHLAGARMVALCTGAFAFAAAGLLDGRRATTHWLHADALASRYPRVRVDPAVLYVDEGDVLTSAGRSAGLDLCLHLVGVDLGTGAANRLARRLVAPSHRPGGQAQYIETPVPRYDDGLGPVLHWMVENLHAPLTIADVARHAGLSTRTLLRRFHDSTGTTPLRWLHERRLASARELLEATDHSIEDIARRCGMGSAANLRHHFTRNLGTSPTQYRRTFLDA